MYFWFLPSPAQVGCVHVCGWGATHNLANPGSFVVAWSATRRTFWLHTHSLRDWLFHPVSCHLDPHTRPYLVITLVMTSSTCRASVTDTLSGACLWPSTHSFPSRQALKTCSHRVPISTSPGLFVKPSNLPCSRLSWSCDGCTRHLHPLVGTRCFITCRMGPSSWSTELPCTTMPR